MFKIVLLRNQVIIFRKQVPRLHKKILQFPDQSSFYAGLYEALYARLVSEGKNICTNEQLIEDSIQDIFIHFITNRENFDHVINIESYFVIILRRKLFQKLSKSHDQVSLECIIDSMSDVSHEIQLIQQESKLSLSRQIRNALKELPKGESQAIKKRFLKGFSYEEIASQNNSTIRTVYNQIHSGIKKLRFILEK